MPHESLSGSLIKPFVIGETKTLQITVLKKEGGTFDLTGSTVFFTVKRRLEDMSPLISKTSDVITEIEILTPQSDPTKTGKAKIFVLPSDTAGLQIGNVVVDVWVVLPTGAQKRVVSTQTVCVEQPVTTSF